MVRNMRTIGVTSELALRYTVGLAALMVLYHFDFKTVNYRGRMRSPMSSEDTKGVKEQICS